MYFISHRGNLTGPEKKSENNPSYIEYALDKGFHVEIDVWFKEKKFYLGHDDPIYEVNIDFLNKKNIWAHAKNIDALNELVKLNIHCFWHQSDDVVLTSKGYLWTFPGKFLTSNSIEVMPEANTKIIKNIKVSNCAGICSDFIENIKTNYYSQQK
tara:strand:- start:356 stop:820 length:465 start_codon:yes stop_codon:yes gene_type:complete